MNFSSDVLLRLLSVFIFSASLLILPKVQAAVGDIFAINGLKYTVLTEDQGTQTGTVSVEAESTDLYDDVVIPASVENHGMSYSVTSFPLNAFYDCVGITSIEIPNSITELSSGMFQNCGNITSIIIPNSVTYIGGFVFLNCSGLKTLEIPNSVTYIGGSAFLSCTGLKSIQLPNNITRIEEGTFRNCTSLENIVIPNSVTSIGKEAFLDCEGLTNIELSESMVAIEEATFSRCISLKSIDIPDSVTDIAYYAFQYCSSLGSINTGNGVNSIGLKAFIDCTSLTNLVIGNSVTNIGEESFSGCNSLESVIIPDCVTRIGGTAFAHCSGLKNVVIPNSVTEIGDYAFYGCRSLTSITIPDSLRAINNSTFDECSGLTSIIIPNSVTTIGYRAFSLCSSATSVTVPDSVTEIGDYAFYGCGSLTNVTIPDSVTLIGKKVFFECNNLVAVYFKGNAPTISSEDAFSSPSIVYYRPKNTGWTNPWNGVPTAEWLEPPEITEQPQSQIVTEGDSVTFSVAAEGSEPLSYQWYKDGVAIENAVSTSYTIESVTGEDLGNYSVVISNTNGEATSDIAALLYLKLPTITVQPVSITADPGTQIVFSIEALNADSYQWYLNDIPISGATDELYRIDSVKGINVGSYKVIASNKAGGVTSTVATLTLTKPYRATATVQVVDGSVVGLTVTDGGWGYTREPKIRIKDGTDTGATGHCVIENGIVTQIILDNPGSNYSGEATVLIGSPLNNTSLRIGVSKVKVKMHLILGTEYQLWSSADHVTWKKVGEPFIAEEEEMDSIFKVEDYGKYFKLQEI